MVNRVWHYHFGRGIVATPNDFGFNGERPTHPELLDWLASEFIARGWSVKKLHKLLVMSATYQQGSAYTGKAADVDADDRYLWRFAPRRLEGEAVRDAMLSVGGQLNEQVGGPSFRPFTVTLFNSSFLHAHRPARPGVQPPHALPHQRQLGQESAAGCVRLPRPKHQDAAPGRDHDAVAGAGADEQLVRAAAGDGPLASACAKEAGDDPVAQVRRAYRLAFGRPPTQEETDRAAALARDYGPEILCWVLLNASEFLYLR